MLRGLKVQRVQAERQAHKGYKVPKEQRALRAQQALKEQPVRQAHKVFKEQLAHKEQQERRDRLAQRVLKVPAGPQPIRCGWV